MMGVLKRLPYTPPLDIVNEPPAISSIDMVPSFAFLASVLISFSISAKFILPASQITGTTRPCWEIGLGGDKKKAQGHMHEQGPQCNEPQVGADKPLEFQQLR